MDFWEISQWMNENLTLFSSYLPHAMCVDAGPIEVGLFVIANVGTSFAYYAIAFKFLMGFWRGLTASLPPEDQLLVGAFVLSCGLSHKTHTHAFLSGDFVLDIVMTLFTAAVSWMTAFHFIRVGLNSMPIKAP